MVHALMLITLATAAPVPPPERLTAAGLTGRWQYGWSGGQTGATIEFRADGWYHADMANGYHYCGWWWLTEQGEVRLTEYSYSVDSETGILSPSYRASEWVFARPDVRESRARGVVRFTCWRGAVPDDGAASYAVELKRIPK